MKSKGFSIIESLITLSLCLLILMAMFEVFSTARSFFLNLKKAQEEATAAMACLDKLRIDLLHAGLSLSLPIQHGTVEAVTIEEKGMSVFSLQESYQLASDLEPGTIQVPLQSKAEISVGREICFVDDQKSERKFVSSLPTAQTIVLSSPLEHSFQKDKAQLFILEKVFLYLDAQKNVLRRRVNTSSPQPLLEDVAIFDFALEEKTNLARIRLAMKSDEEKIYELLVFPKNPALVKAQF